jgi:hypothetical protein
MSLLPSRAFIEQMEAKKIADEKYHKEVVEPAQKKHEARKKEILDSIRVRYPGVFTIKFDASSPAAKLLLSYGFDVTSDTNLFGVLLRPHLQAIAKYGYHGSHLNVMIADVIFKLDYDQRQVQQYFYGPYSTARSWDDKCDGGLHCALDYLRKISNNYLHTPTRTQIETEKQAEKQAKLNANKRSANAETARKTLRNSVLEQHGVKFGKPHINPYGILPAHIPMLEAKAEQETRNREYARIMTQVRKSAPPEADLLGLHARPEENLLVMPSRAEELASIFSPGSVTATSNSSSASAISSSSSAAPAEGDLPTATAYRAARMATAASLPRMAARHESGPPMVARHRKGRISGSTPSTNLLGLHTKPEENLLVMPTRAEELASVFSSSSAAAGSSSSAAATSNSSTGKQRLYYPKVPTASSSAAALGGGGSMRRRKLSQRRRKTSRRTRRRH